MRSARTTTTAANPEEMRTVEIKQRLWGVQDVSEYLSVPVGTLYDWRCKGYGPKAKKVGRHLRYEPELVRRWFAELDDGAA